MCYHASPQPMVTSCFLNSITEIRRVVWIKAYLRGACLMVSSLHSMIITFTLLTFMFGSFIIIAPKHVKYMCVHPLYPVCQGRNPVPSCTLEVKARQVFEGSIPPGVVDSKDLSLCFPQCMGDLATSLCQCLRPWEVIVRHSGGGLNLQTTRESRRAGCWRWTGQLSLVVSHCPSGFLGAGQPSVGSQGKVCRACMSCLENLEGLLSWDDWSLHE